MSLDIRAATTNDFATVNYRGPSPSQRRLAADWNGFKGQFFGPDAWDRSDYTMLKRRDNSVAEHVIRRGSTELRFALLDDSEESYEVGQLIDLQWSLNNQEACRLYALSNDHALSMSGNSITHITHEVPFGQVLAGWEHRRLEIGPPNVTRGEQVEMCTFMVLSDSDVGREAVDRPSQQVRFMKSCLEHPDTQTTNPWDPPSTKESRFLSTRIPLDTNGVPHRVMTLWETLEERFSSALRIAAPEVKGWRTEKNMITIREGTAVSQVIFAAQATSAAYTYMPFLPYVII